MTYMASRSLNLVFPQWQGSGKRKYLYYGAKTIAGELSDGARYIEVDVSMEDDIRLEKGIWGYHQINEQLANARDIIEKEHPEKIFLIGGDCGTEVAPVSYLNKLYGGDLAILWLDAHGDLNTPVTSTSHNFHGMPLRCLLGESEPTLVVQCFSALRPLQVIMGGLRDLDPAEAEFIEKTGIVCLKVRDMETDEGRMSEIIRGKRFHNLYIHIDVDVLDSGKCPWALCPAPDGISTGALMRMLLDLKAKFNIAGISVLELKPVEGMDLGPIKRLVKFCEGI
jgi:arginase